MNFSNIRDDQYHYDQQNPAWRDLPVFDPERGVRIGDSGCGIVSMASCISYLYNDYITPDIVLERMEASGVQYGAEECASWRTPTAIAEEFGVCAAPLETIYDVVDALGAGNLMWCGGRGPWFEPDNEVLREHGHCVRWRAWRAEEPRLQGLRL